MPRSPCLMPSRLIPLSADARRVPAVGAGECGEVGVRERGAVHARGIVALLVHPDRAVSAIVHQHDQQVAALAGEFGCRVGQHVIGFCGEAYDEFGALL